MNAEASPVWSILRQLYNYTASVEKAVKQLCNTQLLQNADSAELHWFCTTTILASNHRDSFCDLDVHPTFSTEEEEPLRSIVTAVDKQGVSSASISCVGRPYIFDCFTCSTCSGQDVHHTQLSSLHYTEGIMQCIGYTFSALYSTMTKISVVDPCDKPLGLYHDLCCRIGDTALRHIITKASLFVAVGSGGNYVQITGWYNIS